MKKTNPKTGDIFAYHLERYGVYCPCQVMYDSPEKIAVLFFNHFSKEIPTIEIIRKSPLLRKNHHYWKNNPFAFWIDKTQLENFHFIENYEIITPKIEDEFYPTTEFDQIDYQYAWQQLPQYIQDNFKTFHKDKLKEYKNLPDYMRESLSQRYRGKITLDEEKSLSELRQIKNENFFSYEIKSSFYNEELEKLLVETPFVTKLEIVGNTPKILDFSKTALNDVHINITGVEKIILNREMSSLFLNGNYNALKEIQCPFNGKLLSLYIGFSDDFSAFSGLEKVPFLRVDFVKTLDIRELKKVGTNAKSLLLMSGGGDLQNILELKAFSKVQFIWLSDVFGFDEFPEKENFPQLKTLMLWSIPKSIGDKIKKEYKDIDSLEIKQLRNEDWLKANLENPLRHWDGREGNPQAKAKKAMKAYTDTYKKLSKKDISNDEQRQILTDFIQIFNQIEAKWSIDTLEREEIYDAYKKLVKLTSLESKLAENLFESWQEF